MHPLTRVRQIRAKLAEATTGAQDAIAMQALAALPGPFLPWTAYTMRPPAIVAVLTDIVIADRRTIVECGSGNSTVYMARLLAQRNSRGRITTLEHDGAWADVVRRQLTDEGLSERVTVAHAPLVDGWYDRAAIPDVSAIDLLVVDGPPAHDAELRLARRPALPHFHRALTADATVVLDDARRSGEQEILRAWSAEFRRRFVVEPGNYAVSRADG